MSTEILELTPLGAGGVSVLQIVGEDAFERVKGLAPRTRADIRAPQLVRLRVADEDLDEALVCVLSPREIELHIHGSPPLVKRILEFLEQRSLARHGARSPASNALVARPARSIEARARERLSSAVSDSGARILLDQAEGALRNALGVLRSAGTAQRAAVIAELLERGRVARFLLEPSEVVLAGAVNAGKSTLFNMLLGENRVIVSDEAGTTRDVVRERAQLGAYPIFLTDTAGLRTDSTEERRDSLERASQLHASRARDRADLVLWLARADSAVPPFVHPRSDRAPESDREPSHGGDLELRANAGGSSELDRRGARFEVVYTQSDRLGPAEHARLSGAVSALRAPEIARARIREIFQRVFGLPDEPWSAGSAAPFDLELMHGLEHLPRDASAQDWDRALAALLDGS